MLRSALLVSALFAVCSSLVIPSREVQHEIFRQQLQKFKLQHKIQLDDNCGAVSVGIQLGQKYSNALSDPAKCQICLDLAILVDNYIDCAEGFLQTKANQWCDDTFANLYYKDVCYDLVNSIVDDLEKATDDAINGTEICTRILGEPCGQK